MISSEMEGKKALIQTQISSEMEGKKALIQTQVPIELKRLMKAIPQINWSAFIRTALWKQIELFQTGERKLIFESIGEERIREILGIENV